MSRIAKAALIAALFISSLSTAAAAEVRGAGASFPSKVYAKWSEKYEHEGGAHVAYRPTGSGDGINQITERKVHFGATDSPLTVQELSKRGLVQLPMVVGGIVPVVNLPGVGDGDLQLDGRTLAEIMLGSITRWDDPRIAELNRGRRLPGLAIVRIVRADKSGTTDGFTRYLSKVSDAFKAQVGASQLPKWPMPVTAAEGNDGMAAAIKLRAGAIAYVSYDRVAHDGLAGVRLRNAAGRFVKASESGFRAAIIESELGRSGDDVASLMDRPGADSWPITSATFILVESSPATSEGASPTLRFLYWCFLRGDELTKGTGFAPLPTSVQSKLAARFASIKSKDGRPMSYVGY